MSQQINLFNPIFLQQKKIFAARTMAQALGVIALGCLLIAATAWYSVGKLRQDAAGLMLQSARNQARLLAATSEFAPRKPSDGLTLEAGDAEAQLTSLRKVAQLVQNGDLGNTHGYADVFRALGRQYQDGLWLTAVSIGAADDMSLQGRALAATLVPAWIARLTREPVLQGKTFGNLQISTPEPAAPAAPAAAPAPVQQQAALPREITALLPQLAGVLAPQAIAAPVVPAAPAAPTPLAFIEFSLHANGVEAKKEEGTP